MTTTEAAAAPPPAASRERDAWRRAALLVGWTAFVVPIVFDVVAVVTASRDWLVGTMPDDAFYYLEIARRLRAGDGFTFDGIHATNGFQPLWQIVLAPLAAVFTGGDEFVKAALLLELACVVVAVLLVMRLIWQLVGPGPALLAGIVLVHAADFTTRSVDGMESGVLVLALAVLATALCAYGRRPSGWRAVLVGVLSALVVFGRLDAALVIWVVPVWMVRRQRAWRPAVLWLCGALVAVPWSAWYLLTYRDDLTTSATVKQAEVSQQVHQLFGGFFTRSYLQFYDRALGEYLRSVTAAPNSTLVHPSSPLAQLTGIAVTVLAVGGFVIAGRRWMSRRHGIGPTPQLTPPAAALTVVGAMVGLKALADLLNAPQWALSWYSFPERVALSMALGAGAWMGAAWLLSRWRTAGVVVIAYLVFACVPLVINNSLQTHDDRLPDSSWQHEIDQAASWVRVHGPPGRYGSLDAGLLGYRLDGRFVVVDLDGLVSNYRNAEMVVRNASLPDRIRANSVDYLVDRLDDHVMATQLTCARVLWRSPGGSLAGSGVEAPVVAPVYVLDVRGCAA